MATHQYIGARYVPRIVGDWTPNTLYEPLTVVIYNFNSYTSKQDVPANIGTPDNNPDYWACTGAYNAQVAEYQEQVQQYKEDITEMIQGLDTVNVTDYDVDNTGVDCTDALQAVINDNPNKTLIFPAGTYLVSGEIEINDPISLYFADDAILDGGIDHTRPAITVNADNVSIIGGQYQGGTLTDYTNRNMTGNAFNDAIFKFYHVSNIRISNTKTLYNSSCGTFTFFSCKNVIVENSSFDRILYGAIMFYNDCKNVKVENCIFTRFRNSTQQPYSYPICSGFSDYTVYTDMIEDFTVNNCTFDDCEWEACDCHGGKNIRFTNLVIHNVNRALIIYADNRPLLNDYNFENAVIQNCTIINDADYTATKDTTIYIGSNFEKRF